MEEQATNTAKRPTFLTVLGILSFIGAAFQIIYSGVMALLGGVGGAMMDKGAELAADNATALQNMEGMDASNVDLSQLQSAADTVSSAASSMLYLGIINVVAAIICVIGVIMMWKLKKTGFFIYAIGEIAAPIATIIMLGMGGMAGAMGWITTLIFPIAFIVLYALNLKHMK